MAKKPIRLPPLKVLRVKYPNVEEPNPCLAIMASVLACWASAGHNATGCLAVEQKLRECMDTPRPPSNKKNNINYHLMRFQKRLAGKLKK